jgi:hypothetical protein
VRLHALIVGSADATVESWEKPIEAFQVENEATLLFTRDLGWAENTLVPPAAAYR